MACTLTCFAGLCPTPSCCGLYGIDLVFRTMNSDWPMASALVTTTSSRVGMNAKFVHGLSEAQEFGLVVEKKEVSCLRVCEQGCREVQFARGRHRVSTKKLHLLL